MRTKRRSAVPVHLPGFRLGAPQADCPEVDIPCLATYLNQQLTRLAQAGLLKGLPTSLMLELRVDETGQVTGVAFDQSCGPQQKKLEARILGWKIKAWIVRGRSTLKVPLQVLQ